MAKAGEDGRRGWPIRAGVYRVQSYHGACMDYALMYKNALEEWPEKTRMCRNYNKKNIGKRSIASLVAVDLAKLKQHTLYFV